MSEAKFTPGPWQVVEGNSTTLYVDDAFGIDGGRDYYLAEMRHGDPDELQANANLIAAAPDLLEALRMFVAEFGDKTNSKTVNDARAAIAKALGEPSHG